MQSTIDIDPDQSLKRKLVEHELKKDDEEYKNTWSCCLTQSVSDSRAVIFFSQLFIMVNIMGFCLYRLSQNESCESQQAYIGLLTLLIGIALPNPKR